MNLKSYINRKVKIIDVDDHKFEGVVRDYIYPDENDSGLESIIIDCTNGILTGNSIEFFEKDIKSIIIL